MPRFVALIAVLALVGVAAGCGGSGDSTTVTTSTLSKAAFVKKANALCETARQKALSYRPPTEKGPEKQIVTSTIHDGILPEIQGAMEEVRELGAPEGDEAKIEAIVVGNEKAVVKAEGESFASLPEMEEGFLSTAEKARAYGIDNCGY